MQNTRHSISRQRGSALLAILIMIGIFATLLVGALKSNPQIGRDAITADARSKAKDALIGYAVVYPEQNLVSGKPVYVPGHLPCPDMGTGTEGIEASSCGANGVSAIGRLPWKTLGLPPLRDGAGECLWYAVSGTFKSGTKPDLLNWDSDGQFRIMAENGATVIAGTDAANFDGTHPVAVIFSAGAPLSGQNRATAASGVSECGGNYTAANYLETLAGINNAAVSATANAITQFITGKPSSTFNDRLVYITPDDIFGAKHIQKRMDFPGTYFSDTANVTAANLNNFTLVGGYYDNQDPNNQYIGGVVTNRVYGLLQKTAQCLVKYGKNNSTVADKRLPWAAPLNVADFANNSFADSANLKAGRPPFIVDASATAAPANTFVASTAPNNHRRLLTTTYCTIGWNNVAGLPSSQQDGWWDKWKDHLFYAVADAFKPTSTVATQAWPCSSGSCLTVDGKGPFAAVLLYADAADSAIPQNRYTLAQKRVASNYLEGVNATSIASGSGTAFTRSGGNDDLICINQDLTIDPTCQNPAIPCLTISTSSVTVQPGTTATVTATNPCGTVTVSSANTAIAKVTYASGVATITGVAAGSTTVTIADNTNSWPVAVTVSSPGSAQVSFATNIGSFIKTSKAVTVNAGTVSLTNGKKTSGCFWYPTASTLSGKTLRAYFEFQFGYTEKANKDSKGYGLTFALLPGGTSSLDKKCGSKDQAGYGYGSDKSSKWPSTSFGVEVDTDYSDKDKDPGSSSSISNHVAFLPTNSVKHSSTSAVTSSCNGNGAIGCFKTFSSGTPNWFEDSAKHNMRIEMQTKCNSTCSTCGSSGSNTQVKIWADCISCNDFSANFGSTPQVNYCTALPPTLNSVIYGFTSGNTDNKENVTISNFGIGFY